jgi:hypothetical protein
MNSSLPAHLHGHAVQYKADQGGEAVGQAVVQPPAARQFADFQVAMSMMKE